MLLSQPLRSCCFVGCLFALLALHREASGQWRQAAGFNNSLGADQVNGFLSYGKYLLANASCPSDQPGATGDSLFASTDDGLTWRDFAPDGGLPLIALGDPSAPILLGLADTNPGTFSVVKWLEYSANLGHTWTPDTLGWPIPNGMPMTMISAGGTVLIGTAVGVSRQTAPGAQWEPDTVGMSVGGMFTYPVTSLIASASAGMMGGIFVSTNNGASWSRSDTGLPKVNMGGWGSGWPQTSAFATSGNAVFALLAHDSTNASYDIYRTTNTGQNWVRMNSTPLELSAFVPQLIASNQQLFVESWDKGIFVSNDDGNAWSQANQGLPVAQTESATTAFHGDTASTQLNFSLGDVHFSGIHVSGGNLMIGFGNGVWVRKLSDFGIH